MNIATLLEMAADRFPDRIAVGDLRYPALLRASRSLADRVRSTGAKHVALLDTNSAAAPIALFGAAYAGVPYVPLNYRLAGDEIDDLLSRLSSAVLVSNHKQSTLERVPEGIRIVGRDALLASSPNDVGESPAPEDGSLTAVQLFTSGTTGKPKGAILRHENLMSYILSTVEFASAPAEAATLISVPPYHIAGVSLLMSSVYSGRRMVMLEQFDARAWLETCVAEKITYAFVVPTMLARIVDVLTNDAHRYDLSALRAITFGGGRMPLAVISRAMELFPHVDFTNAYGLTETSSTICLLRPDDHRTAMASAEPAIRRRLTSVGRPIESVELEIRDDAARPLPAGAAGNVYVRGGQVAGEYLDTGSCLDAAGWFATRDRGYLDEGGFLFLDGRADDVIVKGGENISPGEIEETLLSHPAVLDAAVVAVPDEEWGETVGAAIVLREGAHATAVDLQLWVKARLRSSRAPSVIQFHDELPYNELGKILRRVVRDALKDGVRE